LYLAVAAVFCQIYSEYVQACSALQSEKEENKRLSDYLDRIIRVSCNSRVMKLDFFVDEWYENCVSVLWHPVHMHYS